MDLFDQNQPSHHPIASVSNSEVKFFTGDVHVHFHNDSTPFDVDKAEIELRNGAYDVIEVMTDLQEIESFPLQAAKQNKPQREVFGRKGWFDEWSSEDNTQFYDMYELFDHSKENSQRRANEICRSQKAKEVHVRKHGNIVGATGTAGIGKTTMGKLIINNMINNDSVQKPPLIFYVSLRNVDFSTPCSVLEFLTSTMLPDWDHTPESDKALLKRINEADDVFIFTDALDEARGLNVEVEVPTMNLYQIRSPDVIFKNLYSGHLLPNAKKFLTSRPGAFHDLFPQCKPEFTVTVLGLSKTSQELLCEQACEKIEDAKKVQAMIQSSPDLSSLCFIPMFCRITVFYMLKNITSDLTLVSSTDIFVSFVDDCVRSPTFKGDILGILNLAQLALKGFIGNNLVFDHDDLKEVGVDQACLEAFMHIEVKGSRNVRLKIVDGDKKFFFAHLLWQEFFSALRLMFCASDEIFEDLLQFFNEARWDSVIKFMFGLCNSVIVRKVEALLPKSGSTAVFTSSSFCEKRVALKSFLLDSMQQYKDSAIHSCPPATDLADLLCFLERFRVSFSSSDIDIFKICSWVYELQDVKTTNTIAEQLPDKLLLRGLILPSDVTHLCHVLTKAEQQRCLAFGTYSQSVKFVADDLGKLLRNLHNTPHVLEKLHISNQPINMIDIVSIVNNIDELSLDFCHLSGDDLKMLFESIQNRPTPMKYLSLSGNANVTFVTEHFVQCIPKIKLLTIQSCDITEEFVRFLTKAVGNLDTPMVEFDLGRNDLKEIDVINISRCVHNIQALTLRGCCLTDSDVEMLVEKIEQLDKPMKALDLGENSVGSNGVVSLTRCIGNFRVLELDKNKLTSADVNVLAKRIEDSTCSMKALNLSGNPIDSAAASSLCRCLQNIQHLWLDGCGLTAVEVDAVTDAILNRRETQMESLLLSNNELKDEGAIAISRCLHKIKLLTINGCKLSEAGIKAVRSTNARNEKKCEIFGLDNQQDLNRKSEDDPSTFHAREAVNFPTVSFHEMQHKTKPSSVKK